MKYITLIFVFFAPYVLAIPDENVTQTYDIGQSSVSIASEGLIVLFSVFVGLNVILYFFKSVDSQEYKNARPKEEDNKINGFK